MRPGPATQLLGRHLRYEREFAGLTQARLASLMCRRGFSWHQSTVTNIELGRRTVTFDEAVALAVLFGVDLEAWT